jgi:hypothetical protein
MRNIEAYKRQVDQLFRELRDPPGTVCDWPLVGGHFVKGEDDTRQMRQTLCRALMARDWLAENGPPDAPQLPLNGSDGDRIRFRGGVGSIVGYYDRSLSNLDYEFEKHPSFYDYACGVMALNPTWADEDLKKRFPPRPLDGLDRNFIWRAPEHNSARRH